MNIEHFRKYCISKPNVTEDFPFGDLILVFRVGGKIFSLMDISTFESINLKCSPEKAVELREQYSGIVPGYHMSKIHWNTIFLDGSVPDRLILEMTDHSYELVVSALPSKMRKELGLETMLKKK